MDKVAKVRPHLHARLNAGGLYRTADSGNVQCILDIIFGFFINKFGFKKSVLNVFIIICVSYLKI